MEEHTNVYPTIQYSNENYEWNAKSEEILVYEKNKMGSWEVLLCSEGLPRHEATWDNYEEMQELYPDLHLQGSNVRPPIMFQYSRRNKGESHV